LIAETRAANSVAKSANQETVNAKFNYESAFWEGMFTSSNQRS